MSTTVARAASSLPFLRVNSHSPHPPGGLKPHGTGSLMVRERGHDIEARPRQRGLRVEYLHLDPAAAGVPLPHDAELFFRLGQALPAGLDVLLGRLEDLP